MADLPGLPNAAPVFAPQWLCRSDELEDRGRAHVFDVIRYRQPARAFVMRYDARLVAYLNQCLHVPTEMDWQPGEFLDSRREYILCSIHGAAYEPTTGQCAGGPCGRGRLVSLSVDERDGQVYWYPSGDIRPPAPALAPAPSSTISAPASPGESKEPSA